MMLRQVALLNVILEYPIDVYSRQTAVQLCEASRLEKVCIGVDCSFW